MIGWGIFRVYANVEVMWWWPLIDTNQTLASVKREGEVLFTTGLSNIIIVNLKS